MKISISGDFKSRDIQVTLGVVTCDVMVSSSDADLLAKLDETGEKRLQELDGQPASSVPQIMQTRKAYKAFGKDPARYRPAAEALTRRLLQGKGLYHVNNVVDVNNLVSIKSGISIGTYLADEIKGDVIFRRAEAGESYKGIGRGELNLEGLPVFSDDLGAFGCPTSDSGRTMIREGNHQIIMILISFGENEMLNSFQDEARSLLESYCQGQNIKTQII